MNLIDKLVGYFDPEAGLKRTYLRTGMSIAEPSQNAGSTTRPAFKLWNPLSQTADADTLSNLDLIRSRSRDLIRNNPTSKGVIDTIVSGVLGSGLRLIPAVDGKSLNIGDEETENLNRTIENEFNLWADDLCCDTERTLDFYGLQQMFLNQQLANGDVFAILTARNIGAPYKFAINIIEADQCRTPFKNSFDKSCRGGVKKDEYGAPVSYFFHESGFNVKEIAAYNNEGRRQVIHYFDKTRPGQSRGVPLLTPVMEQIKQLERYSGAELMAAVIAGMFTVFIQDGDFDNRGNGMAAPSLRKSDGAKLNETDIALAPGAIVQLGEGKKIETVNPTRPNAQFQPFFEAIIKQISMGIGIPFEVLIKHFASSYSASQGALLEAWKYFRNRREKFARYFCAAVYERFFYEAVITGRIKAPLFETDPLVRKAYLSSEWIGPAKGMIDELKEIKAAAAKISAGLSTRKIEAVKIGGNDWLRIAEQLSREEGIIKKKGLHIDNIMPEDEGGNREPDTNDD